MDKTVISAMRWMMTAGLLAAALPAAAQYRADFVPPELEGIGIEQKLGAQLDLDLPFRDERGQRITLGDLLADGKPAILTLNYYGCPSLCGIQLLGLLDALRQMEWTIGERFRVITVSFDPNESADLATAKRDTYLAEYDRKGAMSGWRFLTGPRESIHALCRSVGFKYKWVPATKEWGHDAALIFISPKGRVTRYIGGVAFEPEVLRLSLVEASAGKVGTLWDRIFLTCFHYDPASGRYQATAMRMMQVGGGTTAVLLGAALLTLHLRDAARRRRSAAMQGSAVPGESSAA
ncbi:MAG: SCO family protein [Phycisphaerales bacterium]|nr:SCO family protein [Phycisphaerales bacterium]